MDEIDWSAKAEVQRREDGGSDMHYHFDTINEGQLDAMIRWALALPSHERARVFIDAAGVGAINIHDINDLSKRADFPAG